MKKILSALLALTMLLSLAACGSKDQQPDQSAKPDASQGENSQKPVDLKAFYEGYMEQMLQDKGEENTPQMAELEGEMMDFLYPGLKELPCKQLVAYSPVMSSVAFELVLVEAEDADAAEAVKALFEEQREYQISEGAWYPATVEVWENSQVVQHGNYVALIATGEEQVKTVEAYNALFQ